MWSAKSVGVATCHESELKNLPPMSVFLLILPDGTADQISWLSLSFCSRVHSLRSFVIYVRFVKKVSMSDSVQDLDTSRLEAHA